ncbi:MAG: PAS domain S-box protein [Verrucomicrobiota bacterium]|nr:PAS domain S-box protein [Verrucomicrobiota bacterium]
MNEQLHILHLEDDPDFAAMVCEMFARDGLDAEVKRVGDRPGFEQALAADSFDVILSDYHLSSFTGLDALALARKSAALTPFILVSGTIGEDTAVESLKAGATDYVLKQQPERLTAAVRRAVQEAAERRARLESEVELVRREKYFRALTENSLDVLWILNGEGVLMYVSPSSMRVLGCEPDGLVGRSIYDRIHPQDAPRAQQALMAAVEDPARAVEVEVRHRHQDGSWRDVELVGQSRLSDPEIAGLVVHCRDITERRRAENSLRESEKHYRILFNDNPNAMWVFDLQTLVFLEVNEAAIRQYGWSRAEFLDMKLTDLWAPGRDGQVGVADWRDGRHGRVWRHRRKDGSVLEAQVIWTPMAFRERFAALTLATDVTERRRIEHRDFVFSKLGHGLISAATPAEAAMIICESADKLFKWDSFAIDIYAAERDEVSSLLSVATVDGQRVEMPQPVQPKAASPIVKRVIERGAELFAPGEMESHPAAVMLAPIRKGSRVIGILSVQGGAPAVFTRHDLETLQILADHCAGGLERLRAEQELRNSEILFRSVWENSADGMRLTDESGIIVAVNNAFCKLAGMESGMLEGKPFTVVYAATEKTDAMLRRYREFFRTRSSQRANCRHYALHNGRMVALEIADSFIESPGRPLLCLSLFRDVTSQRLLEEQLRQAQKMEAIGQLAGGVAHDFNNILTVIHGHASLLLAAELPPPTARSAQQIAQAAERAAGLTRQLLTFSRRQLIQPRRLDLNQVVGTMSNMLGRLLSEDLALQLNYSPTPALIEADAGMMEQVLLNLAVNARDAMPRGGQLSVGISIVPVEKERARHPDAREGHFVRLSVSDTGCGIAAENLQRIFEPFFTTKEIGKGTGLGLATVYGIVKQHRGWIEVESAPDQGSTFHVFIPYVGAKPDKPEKAAAPAEPRGGTETVLVVEDEEAVRELVTSVLTNYGYKVFTARNGVEAVEVWRRYHDRIALLLTDLIMPDHMNGRELAEKLRAERPDLKVVFTSGYSADIVGKDFKLDPELNFLQKPYRPATLALTVRRCLDGGRN